MTERTIIRAAEQFTKRASATLSQSLHAEVGGPYDGGEPPGGDMLEQRVKHLEDDMREVKSDIKALMKDVAEIKGKIGMLPGWGGLIAVTGFIVAAVGLMLRFMPPAG